MADMSFLDDDTKQATKVPAGLSSGKSEPLKTPVDTKKVSIDQSFTVPLTEPYVQRAIDRAVSICYNVVGSFREAVTRRSKGEKVLSYREADIALRRDFPLETFEFLLACSIEAESAITEDSCDLKTEIFVLRARYNRGVTWLKTDNKNRTEAQQKEGIRRLKEIRSQIESLGLPLHPEEVGVGFHQEFLKPEYMNWGQYEKAAMDAAKEAERVQRMSKYA